MWRATPKMALINDLPSPALLGARLGCRAKLNWLREKRRRIIRQPRENSPDFSKFLSAIGAWQLNRW
jgi:hypothetical protein